MHRRTLLALLAAATLTAATPLAHAAPVTKPQVTDPAGDSLSPVKGFDIVSAKVTTTGVTKTKRVGRKVVKIYTPKNLVASVTLNEPPPTTPGTSIQLLADITACGGGYMEFQYTPGALFSSFSESGDVFVGGCGTDEGTGPAEYLDVLAQTKGNTISWTVPLSLMGSDLPLSTVFSGFEVVADLNEPVFGLVGQNLVGEVTGGAGDMDHAASDVSWKLG